MFSGIGAFEKALSNLNIDYELLGYSEIDKYASKAYSLIHNVAESLNLGDITKIDEKKLPGPIDMITYGFPCQDISVAGWQQGLFNDDGSKTRSGLFFDALRIIEHTQPKIAIAENVKNLLSKKFKNQFELILQSLDEAGYNNYYAVLNSKDYGVPQNRERVFIVSIRKDIDHHWYTFPKSIELKKCLKDMLEDKVDSRFHISLKEFEYMNRKTTGNRSHWDFNHVHQVEKGISQCLTSNIHKGVPYNVLILKGTLCGGKWDKHHDVCRRVYSPEGIAPTIPTTAGGNHEPKVYIDDSLIRKLTPKECFRLMGFDDSDWQVLVNNKISNTQLYKMAGNSIVVDVVEEILCQMFDEDGNISV